MKRNTDAWLNQKGSAVLLHTWLSDKSNMLLSLSIQEAKQLAKDLILAVAKSSDKDIVDVDFVYKFRKDNIK